MAYRLIASGSPCVVPSDDLSNIIIITIIIIITMITMSGHNLDMSWQKSSHMQQARVELLFY